MRMIGSGAGGGENWLDTQKIEWAREDVLDGLSGKKWVGIVVFQ